MSYAEQVLATMIVFLIVFSIGMTALSYLPKRRHFRRGRTMDGYLCVVCRCATDTLPRMWLHKVAHRHPFIGDGVVRQCQTSLTGTSTGTVANYMWTSFPA